jgi:hypothetical protein
MAFTRFSGSDLQGDGEELLFVAFDVRVQEAKKCFADILAPSLAKLRRLQCPTALIRRLGRLTAGSPRAKH